MAAIEIPPNFLLAPEQFDRLALVNSEMRLELTAAGELMVMSPTGGTAGRKNAQLTTQLTLWADRDRTGVAFDSSTVFVLPNEARRSPDAAWVRLERWEELAPEQQDGFPPLVPDFVVELVSPSDLRSQHFSDLQAKMQEYLDNDARLGWLIEPRSRRQSRYSGNSNSSSS